jgi:hypothetical protein
VFGSGSANGPEALSDQMLADIGLWAVPARLSRFSWTAGGRFNATRHRADVGRLQLLGGLPLPR